MAIFGTRSPRCGTPQSLRTAAGGLAIVAASGVFACSFAAPAVAATGEALCAGSDNGTLFTRVIDNGDSTFRVELLDANLLTAESWLGDYYITLPSAPEDLRYGTADVRIGSDFEVVPGSVQLSQGIQSSPPTGALPMDYTLNHAAPPAGESVTVSHNPSGQNIRWIADLDIANSPAAGRALPSDFFFPGLAIDASTSVLTFDIRLTASAPRGTDLPATLETTSTYYGALIEPATDAVFPLGESVTQQLPGCTIPARFFSEIPAVVPPVAPAVPKRVETGIEGNTPVGLGIATLALGSALVAGGRTFRRRALD